MLSELTKVNTIEETRSALHNFIQHIERHPYEKHVAITVIFRLNVVTKI